MSDEILGRIRASSWGELFDCGFRWYAKNILGLRLPAHGATVCGSAIHRGTAAYDNDVLVGAVASIDEAVQVAADYAKDPVDEDGGPMEVDWRGDADEPERIGKGEAVDYAVQLTAKYVREVAPAMSYSAVEVRNRALDVTTEFGTVRLSGTADRIRAIGGKSGICDFKSGGKAVTGIKAGTPVAVTKGFGPQLGVYTLLAEAETGQKLDGAASIIGFQTSSKLWIASGEIADPKLALVGNSTLPGLIELAAKTLKSGVFAPNPRSVLCSRKWCPAHHQNGGPCVYGQ